MVEPVDGIQRQYREALGLALGQPRLWLGGLILAVALTDSWRIVAGWGPAYLGERASKWFWGTDGFAIWKTAYFILIALAAFVMLKAVGYLGEMVLIRQVAGGTGRETPTFGGAFTLSRVRYLDFAITLIPWDALLVAMIYLPALVIAIWERWDPGYDHIFLYILVFLLWFILLVLVMVLAGITAMLACRSSLLEGRGPLEAWARGWGLFRARAGECVVAWLQALVSDIAFIAVAWPLLALVSWLLDMLVDPLGLAPLRWLLYLAVYAILVVGLIVMRTGVQCYKSSLWTMVFLKLRNVGGRLPAADADLREGAV
ncbi:MAG: hypothetical protein SWK76_08225 [Actinomycetota bacterium]|nr:hypothetical protein [Actinomycetota bacterium]